jgi:cell division protein FtsA
MNQTKELAAAIDIGSSRTRAILGRFTPEGKLEVLAYGDSVTQGVRNGVVINIDEAARSIQSAVATLERGLKVRIRKLYAGISGQRISNRQYSCYRMTETGEVTNSIVASLTEEARRHAVGSGEKVYHVVPHEFIIDGERGINNPVGMAGKRIEAVFNVILAAENYEQNLQRSLEKAGYGLAGVFINPFIQGAGFLSRDEKEAGVILLDFGAGTTGMSLYFENRLRMATELPFGGNVISNDIREGCNIIPRHAEMVKIQCGYAFSEIAPENKVAQIPEVDGWAAKEISFKNLSGIIQARLEEILEGVNYQLESTGLLNKLGAGIVITGGGSKLRGIDKLVSYMTGIDVRHGKPIVAMKEQLFNEQLMNPDSASVLGVLIHGLIQSRQLKYPAGIVDPLVQEEAPKPAAVKKSSPGLTKVMSGLFGKAKEGLNGLISDDDDDIK